MSPPSWGERLRAAWRGRRNAAARFTHVVPIGANCRVSYQLRRHLGTDAAWPFDWWIAPIQGTTRYLAELDPARLYDPDALEEMTVDGACVAVRSRRYGVRLLHEFPRVDAQGVRTVVAPGWHAHIAAARARHEHLLARLRALDVPGKRILFVRYKLGIDEGDLDPQACVAALRAALAPHFRRASFEFLLINVPGAAADERGGVHAIDVDEAPAAGPEAWRGDDAAWSRALARSGLLGSTRSGRA